MDDRTAGLVIRALRRRRGWRQSDLGDRAGVSRSAISRAERGWLDQLALRSIRKIFTALEARVDLAPRWKGAELERLLDELHATVVARVAQGLEAMGWTISLEVTYSEFGERGSIDVLALRSAARIALVVEVKTELASSEAVGRKLDEKARLASKIVRERYGWTPVAVGRVLVMPDTMRLRRIVQRNEVIGRMFPVNTVGVKRWLRDPSGAFAGLWFLSDSRHEGTRSGSGLAGRQVALETGRAHARSKARQPHGPTETVTRARTKGI